jgi:integrase
VARARGERPPASKTEAEALRDRLRSEIRSGTFTAPESAPEIETRLTLGDVADQYLDRFVRIPTRRPRGRREMEILIDVLRRAEIPAGKGQMIRLEAKAIDEITRADIEAVRSWRRREQAAGKAQRGAKGGEVGINRALSRLRHLLNWSVVEGFIDSSPFKRGGVSVVKLESSVEHARTRRLEPGEEARLLEHASPHLYAVIVAAIDTGMRLGEILSLQWRHLRRDDAGAFRAIELEATQTKTARGRAIPITSRMRSVLEMRRQAPDGREHPATAFVFGNEVGERVTSVRTAWELTCERAKVTGLHLHDLRREFGSRLLESAASIADVSLALGHTNVTTTAIYLRSSVSRLERAFERMESARFAQDSHKSPHSDPAEQPAEPLENHANLLN